MLHPDTLCGAILLNYSFFGKCLCLQEIKGGDIKA